MSVKSEGVVLQEQAEVFQKSKLKKKEDLQKKFEKSEKREGTNENIMKSTIRGKDVVGRGEWATIAGNW